MTGKANSARANIADAFSRLVLAKRDSRPPVADVLKEAGVARSTLYEHFDGRDSVLIESFRAPMGYIADAAASDGSDNGVEVNLIRILDHLRDYRRGAVNMLTGPMAPRIARALTDLVAARLPGETQKSSAHLADMQLGFIRLWLTGEPPYAAADLARLMIRSAAAQRAVMAGDAP